MEAEIAENEKTYEQLERLIASADEIPIELPKISSAIQKIASGGHECGCGATCTDTCWTDCGSNCANYTRTVKTQKYEVDRYDDPYGVSGTDMIIYSDGSKKIVPDGGFATGGYTGA